MKLVNRIFFVFGLVVISACSGNDATPQTDGKDRTPMLIHWVDNIIVPSLENFNQKISTMSDRATDFTNSPSSATLTAFRQTWVDAYIEWQKVELFEIGPSDKYTLRNFFNIYPTSVEGIIQNINNPSANLEVPASYATQGFPALDYLLNGVASTDEEIVAFYSTNINAEKNLAYMNRLVAKMKELSTKVVNEWEPYRETFISKTSLDIGSSTGLMVNAYVLYYERYIRTGKFGLPSGAMTSTGSGIYPEKVEAFYKGDISTILAKTAHEAVTDFFNGKSVTTGTEGPSLKSYLDALDAKDATTGTLLSDLINEQFSIVNTSLSALPANLANEVQTNNQSLLNVFAEMQKATRMLKVDMTSAMSVTITYTDNDGD